MDALWRAVGKVSRENKSSLSSSPLDSNGGVAGQGVGVLAAGGLFAGLAPPQSQSSLVLVTRATRQDVSYCEWSKHCAIFFVAGVVFGYTLRRRIQRWASKLLRLLTDN